MVSASTKLAKGFSICGSMRFGPCPRGPRGCAQHALAGAGAGASVAILVLFLSMEFMEAENIWKNMEKNGAIQPGKHRHSGAKHMNSTVLGMVHGSYHDPNQQGNGSCESQVMSTTWLPQRASKNRRSRPKSYSSFSYPWRPVFINSLSSMVLSGHARTPGLQDSKTFFSAECPTNMLKAGGCS